MPEKSEFAECSRDEHFQAGPNHSLEVVARNAAATPDGPIFTPARLVQDSFRRSQDGCERYAAAEIIVESTPPPGLMGLWLRRPIP